MKGLLQDHMPTKPANRRARKAALRKRRASNKVARASRRTNR